MTPPDSGYGTGGDGCFGDGDSSGYGDGIGSPSGNGRGSGDRAVAAPEEEVFPVHDGIDNASER